MRHWLWLSLGVVSLSACNSAPGIPATLTLNTVSGNNQIVSSGAASPAPLVVQVLSSSGAATGVALNASTDARYCSVAPLNATTDASGNASFTVSALGVAGVNCTTAIAIVGQPASRGALNFTTIIRPAQRALTAVSSPNLPTATVSVTDAGLGAGSVTVGAASNLPTPDANHVYGVYLAKQDASGNVSAVTLLGKTSSFPSGALTAPTNLATAGFNVVALVLQSAGSGRVDNLNNATLISAFTPVPSGTASVTLSLTSNGLRLPAPYSLPSSAGATVVSTNPNLNLGVAGDGISVEWSGLSVAPSGWDYVVYATDASSAMTRLGTFNSNGRAGTFNYNSPQPSNTAPVPTAITDAKPKFSRVFLTLEPTSSGDGGFASAAPGATVVLDNASSAWTFGAGTPKQQ
jgi:hypothetical protein